MSSRKASAATPPPTALMQAPSTAAYVGAAASSIPSSQQQQRIISAGGASANTVLAGSGNPSRSHTAPPSMSQANHLLSLSTPPRPPSFSLTARATSRPTAICSLPTRRPALTRSPWRRNAPPPPPPPILIPLLPLRCTPPPHFCSSFAAVCT